MWTTRPFSKPDIRESLQPGGWSKADVGVWRSPNGSTGILLRFAHLVATRSTYHETLVTVQVAMSGQFVGFLHSGNTYLMQLFPDAYWGLFLLKLLNYSMAEGAWI
jgi:hypothetical protein